MYISGIQYESIVDGYGIRNTIFVSGCLHHCKNCHNPQTWDFKYGYEFTKEKQMEFINICKENPLLDGLTISGGDPLYSSDDVLKFVELYKENNPNHTIWIYSGFTIEQIIKNKNMFNLIKECDTLVDGLFIEELKDLSLSFKGSSNQRIINIKEYLSNK